MLSGGYFLTGSKYAGDFQHDIGIIDGFGTYVYPDGSEYRGFFKKGRFHGYGTISIKTPNKMLYVVKFKNGSLEKIEEMVFGDGIRLQADQFGADFKFKDWQYLKETDRRFANEIFSGINPVGPDSLLTNLQPTRQLPNNTYDTGDGFFHPKSGFTGFVFSGNAFETRPPYFVSCKKEFNWKCRNCRRSDTLKLPDLIQTQVDQLVLQNNLKCSDLKCSCGKSTYSEKEFDETPTAVDVENISEEDDKLSTTESRSSFWMSDLSSSSKDSLYEVPLKLNMKFEIKSPEGLLNPIARKPHIQVRSRNVKKIIEDVSYAAAQESISNESSMDK